MSQLNTTDLESSDSLNSDLSGMSHTVTQMVLLEQEETLSSIPEEAAGSSPRSPAPGAERISKEEWSKMTRSMRRNFLRRKSEKRDGTPSEGTASGGEKRPRDVAGFTPSPNKEERKRPKTEAPKYSHMVSCLKVAITHSEYPKERLTEEMGNKLAAKLVDLLRENNPEEGLLTFCGFTFRLGGLIINCMDEKSNEWIRKTISKMTPWEGIQLKTCDPKDLEGYIKIATFVPNPVSGVEAALGNIKVQNALDTEKWKILPGGVKVHPKGLYFVASIPESHFKKIEDRELRLACGLHLLEVKRLLEKEKKPKADTMEVEAGKTEIEEPRVEDKVTAGVAEGVRADKPSAGTVANPDLTSADIRTNVFSQLPVGKDKPVTAGRQRAAASGSSARGGAVEKCPGTLGSGPAPSKK